MKTQISQELWQYSIDFGNNKRAKILDIIAEFNQKLNNGHMQTGIEQCYFMGFLAKMIAANHYLEVGIFTGYSLISMATYLPNHAMITALELQASNIHTVKSNIKLANDIYLQDSSQPQILQKIEYIEGNALLTMPKLIEDNKKYDLIFIDANKSSYLKYYEYAKNLLSTNGVLMIDNVFKGHASLISNNNIPTFVQQVHNMNVAILNDDAIESCMIPIADGLTLIKLKK